MQEQENILGETIREYRLNAGLTQAELARKINVIRESIYKYEKGIVKYIPYPVLLKICLVLNIPHDKQVVLFDIVNKLIWEKYAPGAPVVMGSPEFTSLEYGGSNPPDIMTTLEKSGAWYAVTSNYIIIKKSDFTPAQVEQIENFINFIRTQGKDKN